MRATGAGVFASDASALCRVTEVVRSGARLLDEAATALEVRSTRAVGARSNERAGFGATAARDAADGLDGAVGLALRAEDAATAGFAGRAGAEGFEGAGGFDGAGDLGGAEGFDDLETADGRDGAVGLTTAGFGVAVDFGAADDFDAADDFGAAAGFGAADDFDAAADFDADSAVRSAAFMPASGTVEAGSGRLPVLSDAASAVRLPRRDAPWRLVIGGSACGFRPPSPDDRQRRRGERPSCQSSPS